LVPINYKYVDTQATFHSDSLIYVSMLGKISNVYLSLCLCAADCLVTVVDICNK